MQLMSYAKILAEMNNNTDRLLDAIEHTERYSDEELNKLFEDEEIKEIYDLMSKAADSLTETSEPDIDEEWNRFISVYCEPVEVNVLHLLKNFFNRNAAAVLIGIISSVAVVAATVYVTYSPGYPEPSDTVVVTEPVSTLSGPVRTDSSNFSSVIDPSSTIAIFKDKSLGDIISAMADYYDVTVEYKNESSKKLRLYFQWDKTLPLSDIVRQLNNFEQIRINISGNVLIIE